MKKIIKILFVILMIFIGNSYVMYSQSSTFTYEVPGYIGNLNSDSSLDVIYYGTWDEANYVPSKIAWGCETTYYDSSFSTSSTFSTYFSYPDWDALEINLFVSDFNQDSIDDINFFLKGKVSINDSTVIDTSKFIVILGQDSISTLDTLFLGDIDSIFTTPFIAFELKDGLGFSDPGYRTMDGYTSYIYNVVSLDTIIPSQQHKILSVDSVNNKNPINYKPVVYPNPSSGALYIRFNPEFLLTNISIRIIDINGSTVYDDKTNHSYEDLIRLNTNGLPSGFYYIIISCNHIVKYTFPLIIQK